LRLFFSRTIIFFYNEGTVNQIQRRRNMSELKGYVVSEGYMGYVNGKYMLFATEGDYEEYLEEG
jgi:hypothetical protein